METGRASARDLYPSAWGLFGAENGSRRRRRAAFVWLLAGALAALLGWRVLAWADRNL